MAIEKGSISIHTENIFPIIKKWLYSEKDIFLREIVSNASDAISKRRKLGAMGEAHLPEGFAGRIDVTVSKKEGTIRIADNGLGMTDGEVKSYINQIAFSGAQDFLEKYKDKTDDQQIIGHFGLGFYSSFMVSTKVRIDTLSFQPGATAVSWQSTGDTEFEMGPSERAEVGTTITMWLAEDSLEFLDVWKTREVLKKYFAFLQYEIYVHDADAEPAKTGSDPIPAADAGPAAEDMDATNDVDAADDVDATEDGDREAPKPEAPKPVNNTSPLWLKNPRDCTDEEYKEFYREVFMDFNEPLFWIHVNMDYPFNMKGIIYFPKLRHEFETNEGKIKLYYNQVYVADNIKEVIPEFLMLLKGTLDCPDLPLNVSRSFLQNEGYVHKISAHITKKVADKLQLLYKKDHEDYLKYWTDIHPFVKYGCMREPKFYEKVKDIVIYKTTEEKHVTLPEYLEAVEGKHKNTVYYVNDAKQQSQYVRMFKEHGMEALVLDTLIDNHFISFLEEKNHEVKFLRVDADITDTLRHEDAPGEEVKKLHTEKLEKIFRGATGNEALKVSVEALKSDGIPAMILLSEQSRRFREMSRSFGGGMDMSAMFPNEETLVLNLRNPLIQRLMELDSDASREEDVKFAARHIHDIAMMGHKPLDGQAMSDFLDRSSQLLSRML